MTIDRSLLPSSQTGQAATEARQAVNAQSTTQPDGQPASPAFVVSPPSATPNSLEDVERQHILAALAQANWVIEGDKGAARMLSLHPNTLRSRLKKMGIQRPKM